MDFKAFQEMNLHRCNTKFRPINDWTPQDWALAIAGEVGELCNILKKVLRGDFTLDSKRQEILKEIADTMCYCDLFMSRMGADTGEEILKKFDEVSQRVNYIRAETEPWIQWVEPFGPNSEAVIMRCSRSTAIAKMKHKYPAYTDEEAVADFIAVHWAVCIL